MKFSDENEFDMPPSRIIRGLIAAIMVFGLLSAAGCTDDDKDCLPIGRGGIKRDILAQVNRERAQGNMCGAEYYPPVHAVSWNEELADAALRHSMDMAENEFMDHRGSDGSLPADRMADAGYEPDASGENVGFGNSEEYFGVDSQGAVRWWMGSPDHCANIMSPAFTEIGAAAVAGGCSGCDCLYWTLDFGFPKNPLIINSAGSETD